MDKLDNLITLREASKISGYNSDYLGYLIRSGKMHGRKVGRNWMTTTEDVKYYLANLTALSKIARKPINFSSTLLTIFIALIITLGVYYGYTIIYQDAYSQAAVQADQKNTITDVRVEKNLQ